MLNDLRQAIRALWRQPAFTAVAVLTLALGIGANTALFSVADAVLLRPLPYPEPERLAWIDGAPLRAGKTGFVGLANRFHESAMFEAGGIYATGALNVGWDGGSERVRAAAVSTGFLTALAVQPTAGRVFTEEDVLSSARVVVVGHTLARRRELEPGDTLVLNGRAFTVVGVMPARVDFPGKSDLWIPMGADSQITGVVLAPLTLARLAPGVSPELAAAEIVRLDEVHYGRPRDSREREPRVVPLAEFLVGSVRPLFVGVFAAVLLVLLIACINTANLLLARVSARQREISVRRALGASRFRLVRYLLTESALLALTAGIVALPVALWTLDGITALLPADIHTSGAITIDARAVAATGALCALATVLFGMAPAWSLRRSADVSLLHRSSSGGADPFWRRFRSSLVVAELAVALVLVASAAGVVATVNRLMQVDLGVTGERALTMETTLPLARYDSRERVAAFYDRVESALAALPGVEAVGATSVMPGSREVVGLVPIVIDGLERPTSGDRHAVMTSVTPGYFLALGIEVIAGQHFTAADRRDAPRVAIVSERVTRAAGLEPRELVGRRMDLSGGRTPEWATIVGVTRDVALRGPEGSASPQLYVPMAQSPAYGTTFFAVKTTTPPAGLAPAVRTTMAGIDPELPLYNMRTFDEVRAAFIADRRFAMTVMSAFGLLATLLAGIGLYGVLTYLVQLRTREIGIRMALGASPGAVRRQIVQTGLAHGAAGLAVGAVAAYAASQFLVSRIPGVEPAGAALVAGAALCMLAASAVITWLPARRATTINPVLALRVDD